MRSLRTATKSSPRSPQLEKSLHFPFTLFPCTPLCYFLPVYTPFCLPLFSLLLCSHLFSSLLNSSALCSSVDRSAPMFLPSSLRSSPIFIPLCSFILPSLFTPLFSLSNGSLLRCQRQTRHRQIYPEAPLSAVSTPKPEHHKAWTQENYH